MAPAVNGDTTAHHRLTTEKDHPMSAREFPHRTGQNAAGKIATVSVITCANCAKEGEFRHVGAKKPPEAMEQYFRNHGWNVGSKPSRDLCPECVAATSPTRKPRGEAPPFMNGRSVTGLGETPPAAEPAREMTLADKRIIFAKINEVYLDNRYESPWTDGAVAKDLGVPRDWVRQVREELIGPDGSNEDYEEFLKQVADLRSSFAAALEWAAQTNTKLESRLVDLEKLGRRIEKEISRA